MQRTLRLPALAGCLGTALWLAGAGPQGPSPKPAVVVAPVQPQRHAIEGVYELRRRVVRGVADPKTSHGYVAITNRHLLLCMAGPGTDPDLPLLRAGVRSWKQKDDVVETEVMLGFFTDEDGGVHIDPRGEKVQRRIDVARGLLRIHQDQSSFLEFVRIE